MKTEMIEITKLRKDPRNARKHGEKNMAAIMRSLAAFAQQKPIVIGVDGEVIAGSGTLEAAQRLGWTKIAVVRSKLTGAQAQAFAIADNRTAELAEWDDAVLAATLDELMNSDSLEAIVCGFDEDEIKKLLKKRPGDLPARPDTSPQLARMEYRIVVDCNDEEHQAELLARFEEEGLPCRALMS